MQGTLKDLTPGHTVYVRRGDIVNYDGGTARAKVSTSLLQGGRAADAVEVHMTDHGHVEFRRGSRPTAPWANLIVG